ncbi:uncharacterized protein LOC131165464 isoform X2 [Malania oleifera]|nr:uncharacterized protein LOC131165464 isoform X2 [Malania oleifera]
MEDSSAMTIEFLRARLLSERSVSRTARQRADELAKRVVELEEQLKFVSLQRKKAEKATADVLAILENNGISDVSEALDSSSDQEGVPYESKVSNNSTKEEESSVSSKGGRNDAEELSGSEIESSSLAGGSLSWKSRKNSRNSHERKYLESSMRRRSSFSSAGYTSPKQCPGKSCRQIRRRETRSAVEDPKVESVVPDAEENEVATNSDGSPNCFNNRPEISGEASENQESALLEGLVSDSLEDQRKETSAGIYLDRNGGEREREMEKALEHQAQLIGRYEAEEKAQREWEEKFRENNSSTPDSCEPGDYSDITEERDECKTRAPQLGGTIASLDKESKVEDAPLAKELPQTHSNGYEPPQHVDMGCLQDHKSNRTLGYGSPVSEFALPRAKEKQKQEHSEHHSSLSSAQSSPHHSHQPGFSENLQSANITPLSHADGAHKTEVPGSQKEPALMPNEAPDGVGSVLDALQHARLSLRQRLDRLPFLEGSTVEKAVEPSFPAMSTAERAEIPIGCARLFRVPTDFQVEATTAYFAGSSSGLSLTNYYPDTGNALKLTAGDQFATSPYVETRSSASSTDGRLAANSKTDGGLRISQQKPSFISYLDRGSDRFLPSAYVDPSRLGVSASAYVDPSRLGVSASDQFLSSPYQGASGLGPSTQKFDPYLDAGLPSSTKHTYPIYPDPISRFPSYEGFSTMEGFYRPSLGRTAEPQSADRFLLYDDHIRPNMYR